MKFKNCREWVAALVLMTVSMGAQAIDIGVDAHAGTMGPGVGLTLGLSDHLNLRVGVNAMDYDIDVDDDEGLDYDASLDLSNQYAVIDWFPTRLMNFRLTAGFYLNDNEISASATVLNDNDAQIGPTDALAGTIVRSGMTFDDTAGYVGIGWGNDVSDGFFHFGFDIGVVLQGEPKVSLDVFLPPGDTSGIDEADIAAELQDLEDEVSDFDAFPLVQFNFGFSF